MKRPALALGLTSLLISAAALVGCGAEANEVPLAAASSINIAEHTQQQVRAAQVAEIGGEATLRAAFNKDKGKVRLLMILSPT